VANDELKRWAAEFVERQKFALVSFLVAFLPEHVKEWPRVEVWVSRPGVVLSGAVETITAAGLFFAGVIAYVTSFARGPGWEFLSSRPTTTFFDWAGVGALGFWSYFFTPSGMFFVYCLAEGMVRTFEVLLTGRKLGVAAISIPWRLAEHLKARSVRARLALLLGPARPDEVVMPAQARSGMLEIYTVEDKRWSERQVLEYGEEFWMLAGTRLVPRSGHHAWRHSLQPLEAREVIRGIIVRYDPAVTGPEPAQPPTAT